MGFNGYRTPCKGCEKRYVGCHSTCEGYLKARAEGDALKEKMLEDKRKRNDIASFRQAGIRKALRQR